ncbi:metal-dependent hydrolase [Pseudonocardiaceae bacterium YIM PH 21723]|nr:metal-dependent hydrolase [Pseudonocardiaceae bacterium YIM PH 21723]
MCTGPTHAIHGLVAWSAVTAVASGHAIGQLSPQTWVAGAVLASGAALLPDIDSPSSTIARTFGPFSQGFSSGISAVSSFVYRATRRGRDSNRTGGHRGLTHTLIFAALAAVLTAGAVQSSSRWALPLLMFVFTGLAVRGIMREWEADRDALAIAITSIVITLLLLHWVGNQQEGNAGALGVAVFIGCVAHFFGDAITEQGCPMLWPIPIMGKTWFPVAPPKVMRIRTGGWVELGLVLPAFTALACWLSLIMLQRFELVSWLDGVRLIPTIADLNLAAEQS